MSEVDGSALLGWEGMEAKIVITGGSGLIGRALAAELVQAGAEVVIVSRSPEKLATARGVSGVRWSPPRAGDLLSALSGASAVVHLAGENLASGRWSDARKIRFRNSRVATGQMLADALSEVEPRPATFIQASAVGFYGPRAEGDIRESEPPGDDYLARLCVDWEAATAPVEALGVRRAVIRTGVVLAADEGALPKMVMPFKMFAGGPMGSGDQWVPWIHLADEVGAIRFLLEREDLSGAFNLTAPEPVTNRRMAKMLGKVLRRPSLIPAPSFALRAALGEMSSVVLEGQRAVPARLEEAGYEFQFPGLEAALRDVLT